MIKIPLNSIFAGLLIALICTSCRIPSKSTTSPTVTPTPSPTETETPAPTATPSPSATPSPTPTPYACTAAPSPLPGPCSETSGLRYNMVGQASSWMFGYGAFVTGTLDHPLASLTATPPGGSAGPYTYSVSPALPDGILLDTSTGALSGTPAQTVPECTFVATVDYSSSDSCSFVLTVRAEDEAQSFTPIDSPMAQARVNPLAVTLQSGKVLILGGTSGSSQLASAEIYDPATKTFAATGSRSTFGAVTATLLDDGTVLVGGGYSAATSGSQVLSLDIFNPTSGTFSATGASLAAWPKSAIRLSDGSVLFLEGNGTCDSGTGVRSADHAGELYDPDTGTLSSAGVTGGTVGVLLNNGNVLVRGFEGCLRDAIFGTYSNAYSTSAIEYDPTGPSTTVVGVSEHIFNGTSPTPGRGGLLANGDAIFSDYSASSVTQYFQTYNPLAQTFSTATKFLGNSVPALGDVLVLSDGSIVLTGRSAFYPYTSLGNTVSTVYMNRARTGSATVILQDERVLVVGGASTSAEYYVP